MQLVCWTNSPDMTRRIGQVCAHVVKKGDVIILSGDLGAGKTTFTQGLATGLDVKGAVSSPTFIVSRIHPPRHRAGIALIHADAYRITDMNDVETLDLDMTLHDSVTVIEWGEGKMEALSPDYLHVTITKPGEAVIHTCADGSVDLSDMDDGERKMVFSPASTRWDMEQFEELLRPIEGLKVLLEKNDATASREE